MAERTATIELLTASVRVLQVGSRQVTLSVFRQLDWVPAGEIEPFGRVQDKAQGGEVHVVGSHHGVLARAEATIGGRHCSGDPRTNANSDLFCTSCRELDGLMAIWRNTGWRKSLGNTLIPPYPPYQPPLPSYLQELGPVSAPSPQPWSGQSPQYPPRPPEPDPVPPEITELDRQIGDHGSHSWDVWHPSREIYERFAGLPLIVLAGLR